MKSNDLYILEKLKRGDSSGYRELFDSYYKPLCVYSLKYCDSFALSEDIVQDLFIKIWDEKIYMKLEGNVSSYLFKAVKNNTLQAIKEKSKYHFNEIEDEVNKLMADENSDIDSIEEERRKINKEIEALPAKCKEVFKAIVLYNLKYKEVASQLGVSVNTVKTHYARALRQLRRSLTLIMIFFFS